MHVRTPCRRAASPFFTHYACPSCAHSFFSFYCLGAAPPLPCRWDAASLRWHATMQCCQRFDVSISQPPCHSYATHPPYPHTVAVTAPLHKLPTGCCPQLAASLFHCAVPFETSWPATFLPFYLPNFSGTPNVFAVCQLPWCSLRQRQLKPCLAACLPTRLCTGLASRCCFSSTFVSIKVVTAMATSPARLFEPAGLAMHPLRASWAGKHPLRALSRRRSDALCRRRCRCRCQQSSPATLLAVGRSHQCSDHAALHSALPLPSAASARQWFAAAV